MRSQCKQRIKGTGTKLAFVEWQEMYFDYRPKRITFPNDKPEDAEYWEWYATMCGSITEYNIKDAPV